MYAQGKNWNPPSLVTESLLKPFPAKCVLTPPWFLLLPYLPCDLKLLSWSCSPRQPGTFYPGQVLSSVSVPETRSIAVDLFLRWTFCLASGVLCWAESPAVFLVGFSLPGLPSSLSSHPVFVAVPIPCPVWLLPNTGHLLVFLPPLTLHPSLLFTLPHPPADLLAGPSASSLQLVLFIPARLAFHEMPVQSHFSPLSADVEIPAPS